METITKFKPNDLVWVLDNNKAKKGIIKSIWVDWSINESGIEVFLNRYYVKVEDSTSYSPDIFAEELVFNSRDQLVNSL